MKTDERKVVLHPELGGASESPALALDRPSGADAERELLHLRARLDRGEESRQDRVIELRAMIASGSYAVNTALVARRLLRDVLGELVA